MRYALVAIAVILLLLPEKMPVIPSPDDAEFSELDTWETFHHWLKESDEIQIPDTDFVLKMATRLKERGVLSDISCLNSLAGQNKALTQEEKERVLDLLENCAK